MGVVSKYGNTRKISRTLSGCQSRDWTVLSPWSLGSHECRFGRGRNENSQGVATLAAVVDFIAEPTVMIFKYGKRAASCLSGSAIEGSTLQPCPQSSPIFGPLSTFFCELFG